MIIKELQLHNIRSYADTEPIRFSNNISLLFGNVGAGKSSILYAIEFALFGLVKGELEGAMLLRRGCDEGSVMLVFEQDGKDYCLCRKLKRTARAISQVEGIITVGGDAQSYAVNDMKQEVIRILRFNEKPSSNSSSVIYRYGVFTPQEQMKDILLEDTAKRLATLRHAFGLERYAVASTNAENLKSHLSSERKVLTERAKGLEEARAGRANAQSTIQANKEKNAALSAELQRIVKKIAALETSKGKLRKQLQQLDRVAGEVPVLDDAVETTRDRIAELEEEIHDLKQRKRESEAESKKIAKTAKPTDKSVRQLGAEETKYQEEKEELINQRGALQQHLRDFADLLHGGVCPLCERELDNVARFRKRHLELKRQVQAFQAKLKNVERAIRELTATAAKLEEYERDQKQSDRIGQQIARHVTSIAAKIKSVESARQELTAKQADLQAKRKLLKGHTSLASKYDRIEAEIKQANAEKSEVDGDIAVLNKDTSNVEAALKTLTAQIAEKEKALRNAQGYEAATAYLKDYFIPTIGQIERVMLQAIRDEFDRHFQRYFGMTIGTTEIEAFIDETFSPVITQQGYEMQFRNLSGGEKTSLALAYRLALNLTVKKLSKLDKTLLILDEPTDGFSRNQVLNLRDVLDDLGCDQTILVSHEEEIKGFVDRVYTVRKVDQESTIAN